MTFQAASPPMTALVCRHCGGAIGDSAVAADFIGSAGDDEGGPFCCTGCQAAWRLVKGLGLASYYDRRCIDPDVRPLKPAVERDHRLDVIAAPVRDKDGVATLHLMVEGLHCAACVWLIESILSRQPGVTHARLNMTTQRLVVRWQGEADPAEVVAPVLAIGYRLVPYDPASLGSETLRQEKELLRCMAVAGFAASNIMLLSVSVWAGKDMEVATRDLFHWISALIAFPALFYAGRPFFRSAFGALRHGRSTMDVPISVGITLVTVTSLWQTIRSAEHAYFDASISLVFFILIGRYLDSRARGRARSAAEHLLGLAARSVVVVRPDGLTVALPPQQVEPGMTALVAVGERIGVDGVVTEGVSEVDNSLLTGETTPETVCPGDSVFAGTLNLAAPLRLTARAVGEGTLLADIVRMMEAAEQGRARYVAVADRVARWYAPVVHLAALSTFLGRFFIGHVPWETALMNAIAVLIITCPCALALAVPVVQVIASGRLFKRGILVKSATALERLTGIDTVVFDKTGTLTLGRLDLIEGGTPEALRLAASLAGASRHPLARALSRVVTVPVATGVTETPGSGLSATVNGRLVRLGSRAFCGVGDDSVSDGPELWLADGDAAPVLFRFTDQPRPDAAEVVAALKRRHIAVELLSGDREPVVRRVAASVGIDRWQATAVPASKVARLEALKAEGRRVLMVGDGLNDAPALAAASVSMSPSSAVDISQTTADLVFQGDRLGAVVEAIDVARLGDQLVKQNFGLAFVYNAVTIPLAIAGYVTPLVAAIAMSSSSVLVIVNALRLSRRKRS